MPAAGLDYLSIGISLVALANSLYGTRRSSRSTAAQTMAQNIQVRHEQDQIVIYNNSEEAVEIRSILIGGEVLPAPTGDLFAGDKLAVQLPPNLGSEHRAVTVGFRDCRGWSWERTGRQQPRRVSRSG